MMSLLVRICILAVVGFSASVVLAQIPVTTYHYDNTRSGLNSSESILTTANVNAQTFGLLFSQPVDGQIYAQPLYLPSVTIPGKGVHNVTYVCTENNSVYAFDADSNSGTNAKPLWHANFGPAVPSIDLFTPLLVPVQGITATPVIVNTATPLLYVVTFTKTADKAGDPVFSFYLHALDVTTGAEKLNGPVLIQGSVAGTGDGSVKGTVAFNARLQMNRAALLYVPGTGTIYVAFGSQNDHFGFHGWLFGYNASNLHQVGILNTGPNSKTNPSGYPLAGAGIWQGGSGPASDGTNVYFSTGNGWFQPSIGSYGDSILRIKDGVFSVADYFTPFNQATLDDFDTDLGSGGILLLPQAVNAPGGPNLLVQMGKAGTAYLLDTANLGKYGTTDSVVQEQTKKGILIGAPAYFNGTVYFGITLGPITAQPIKAGAFTSANPTSETPISYQVTGGAVPSISSNGTTNGIVWATQCNINVVGPPGALQAFDATNLAVELYNSAKTSGRDSMPQALKFTTPVVDNGKVYVGTSTALCVFGLGKWPERPIVLEESGTYRDSVSFHASDATPNTFMTYTIDGSEPTSDSKRYTEAVTLTQSATVLLRAFREGYGASAVAQADFLINPSIGHGTGLLGRFLSTGQGHTSISQQPQVDPAMNFNWKSSGPFAGMADSYWNSRWTGFIEAKTTGWHTISVNTDDSVEVRINGQLTIDGTVYTEQPAKNGKVYLVAGTKVPIQIELSHNGGGGGFQLLWSGPGLPKELVPTSQLYPGSVN